MNKKLKGRIIQLYGTQADFSTKIKKSEAVVSRIIRGRRTLSKDEQKVWAKALKCRPKDLGC